MINSNANYRINMIVHPWFRLIVWTAVSRDAKFFFISLSRVPCSFCFLSLWKGAIRTAVGDPINVNLGRMFGCRTKRRSVCLLNHGLTWATGLIKLSGWPSPHCSVLWKTWVSPQGAEKCFDYGVADRTLTRNDTKNVSPDSLCL